VKAGPIRNPVVVFTGGTDPLPGTAAASLGAPVKASADVLPVVAGQPAKGVPMPRPRPAYGTDASAGDLVQ
jgi:hypothetical protein